MNKLFLSKVLNFHPPASWIWVAAAGCLALVFTLLESFLPAGPDSELYKGLSQNLLNGTGYIDTIRNDFILPTIGHPLLLSLFSLVGVEDLLLSKLLFFIGLILSFYAFKSLNYSLFWCVFFIGFISFLLPSIIINSAESTLFCAVSFTFLSLFRHIKKQSIGSGILLGLSMVLFLFIRPLLLPALWVLVPLLCVAMLIKKQWRTPVIPALLTLVICFYTVQFISTQKYADTRLTSGTYGSITLYSAFNSYVNLETTYYSSLWSELPESEMKKGTAPLKLTKEESWQDRDQRLKRRVVDFVKAEPSAALSGYWWRFQKFSLSADNALYIILFFGWLMAFVLAIKKQVTRPLTHDFLIVSAIGFIPLYMILIQSLFVYAGYRYCLVSGLGLVFSIGYLGRELFFKNKSEQVN